MANTKLIVGLVAAGAALTAGVMALPLLVVAAVAGGSSGPGAGGGTGFGTGLRPGTVPAAYVDMVVAAGSLCAAAPPSIIAAQIEQESNWNPNAVSSAGAQGIAQFLPGTWPSWSQPGQSPFDPAAAIAAQGKYDCAIADLMTLWQGQHLVPADLTITELMLAGYNAGPYGVKQAGGIPQNGQTPAYVTRIVTRAAFFADTTGVVPGGDGSFGAKVVQFAMAQLGVPYAYAGGTFTGPSLGVCQAGAAANDCHIVGFDCSGLTLYAVYQASGGAINLVHYADTQTRGGTPVDRAAMQPGDLISFTDPGATVAHHVGIYLGNGQMVNAPQSGDVVKVATLSDSYWQGQSWRIVRYG